MLKGQRNGEAKLRGPGAKSRDRGGVQMKNAENLQKSLGPKKAAVASNKLSLATLTTVDAQPVTANNYLFYF